MSICLCCPCSETLRGAMSVSDAAKRDVLDEVEFRQACLRANLKRLRGTCSMYLRDARECARERNTTLARAMLFQKALMEKRASTLDTHMSVLESVRVSLLPGSRRCVSDMATCRAILTKMPGEAPRLVREGENENDTVDAKVVEDELRGLMSEYHEDGAEEWDEGADEEAEAGAEAEAEEWHDESARDAGVGRVDELPPTPQGAAPQAGAHEADLLGIIDDSADGEAPPSPQALAAGDEAGAHPSLRHRDGF